MTLKIYGTTTSPYTRRVRVVAHEKGVPVEFVIENPLAETTQIATLNPLGKIPVLIREDGSRLVDSPLIAEYLDTLAPEPRLLPLIGPERFAVRQWEAIADGALDAAILVRMENLRPETERSAIWIARQLTKTDRSLGWLDRELGKSAHCVGASLTLADITVGCAWSWLNFRLPDGAWGERFANLGRLAGELEQRDSFRAVPLHA